MIIIPPLRHSSVVVFGLPCLTYDGKTFWLAFIDTRLKDGSFKDTHNYIVNAPMIEGPWSDPIYVNSSGFDPSLFHDDDGRKCNKLISPRKNGPHLYKRNVMYFLLVAEGGTGYGHACTLARSRAIFGPYETHPQKHILTSKETPFAALQLAGHGDLVDTPDGGTYLVHLASRPVTEHRRCILGRETAIQEVYWGDGDWLYVKDDPTPSLHVDLPAPRHDTAYWAEQWYKFDEGLPNNFQWLRTPDTHVIFSTEGAKLTLFGREAIGRQTHFSYDAETLFDFQPTDERQMAGLTAYYSRYNLFYIAVASHSDGQKELVILSSEASWPECFLKRPFTELLQVPNDDKVKLALTIRGTELQFYYALGADAELNKIGPESFTGAFSVVACSNMNGIALPATNNYFVYRPVRQDQQADVPL
ncbi:hypothetical protein GQ53DRAFT_787146 [Thozetella sp. PMI_491]|nr:hypothetical protein GQ53DRAFT_787146 [Thozetella sp. PMI_491]